MKKAGDYLVDLETTGYAIVREVVDPAAAIAPVVGECAELLDGIANAFYDDGTITHRHEDLNFDQRLIAVQSESGVDLAVKFDPTLPASRVSVDDDINLGPAIFALMTNADLLDLVEKVIGPNIDLNPVNHIRMKVPTGASPPNVGALTGTTPWHQDRGACLEQADDSTIVIAWVPLNTPSIETGTLQVIPMSHRWGLLDHSGPDRRVRAGSIQIAEEKLDVSKATPILVEPGDIVLMKMDTVHGSLPNRSASRVRISCEFRYQRRGDHSGRHPLLPVFALRSADGSPGVTFAEWKDGWLDARERLADVGDLEWHRWR